MRLIKNRDLTQVRAPESPPHHKTATVNSESRSTHPYDADALPSRWSFPENNPRDPAFRGHPTNSPATGTCQDAAATTQTCARKHERPRPSQDSAPPAPTSIGAPH